VPVVDRDVLALGDQELDRFALIAVRVGLRGDLDAALVLVVPAELDPAVHLGDDRAVLRPAGLEQLGHPRQTAGDVAGLGAFGRHPREDLARLDLVAVRHRQNRADRQQVAGLAAVGQAHVGAVRPDHAHGRTQVRTARAGAPVGDHPVGDAGGLVGLLADGQAVHQVLEAHATGDLGENRGGVRVPLGQALALLDRLAVLDPQARAVRRLVRLAVLAIDGDGDDHVAAHGHQVTVGGRDGRAGDPDHAVVGRLEERPLGHLRGAADVEGPHGQLGARLADRLGRDDPDRLADVDRRAAGQVATVAGGADAGLGLAGQGRTDLDRLHARRVDLLDDLLHQIGVGLGDDVVRARLLDVFGRVTAEDPLAEADQHVAALDHRPQGDAAGRAAVFLGDDRVLGHVDQTTGQVTGVGGLQGGVGQALAGAVGRVEVLQHGQAFLEVRHDRRLDDLAGGLGHQAAHAAQLLHLSLRAPGAGVGHHVDRVDLGGAAVGQLLHLGDLAHHLVGDLVRGLGPSVDDLVVLLALGDQAVRVLLLVLLDQLAGFLDQFGLPARDDDV